MADDNMENIINNFKNMLHNNQSSDDKKSQENGINNLNITPEMIGNLANMLKNNTAQNDSATSDSFNQNTDSSSNDNDSNSMNNIDFETILKLKSIMETLNKKDDPRSKLLYSLKPYLRESKQKKLDQYVNLFKITQISNLFKNNKGDGN